MNNVRPIVIDWWIAFYYHKSDLEREMQESANSNQEMSPEEAGEYLQGITGQ